MTSKSIVVVGSCMIDFVSFAPRLPKPGETIHGSKFMTTFGGKGANQCVAAAKLGGNTTLITRVGDDLWGDKYIENLKCQNVETKYAQKTPNSQSGIAQITVAESGENQIVVVAGANNLLTVQDVEKAQDDIIAAAVVVLQLETSTNVALKALKLCQGTSILNGAPALNKYDPELLTLPTIFCVNETEAAVFTGLSVTNKREAEVAIKKLIEQGCNAVIVTLGEQGAICMEKNKPGIISVSCPVKQCVDTTGAGDAFIGALSFLLANYSDMPLRKILENACFIASDSVIFLVHFVFIALSSMGFWNTSAFLFYNFILILLLVWSIYHPQNEEPVQLAIVVNGVSIFLDILLLVMCYPTNGSVTGLFAGTPQQSSYEDIDKNIPHPSQSGSYGFANAQQI
ncbi:ribokinase [Asbolus verrucosus]|uniref:Ribokinase n=1 Tax=Asbolus verrucosus TaxID=1661398 RepID=A0A482WAH6_ASBVE|nr:ribokinase [Asbolus verrucosus]